MPKPTNNYDTTQGVLAAALIYDLRKGKQSPPLIKFLSEDLGLSTSAFTNPVIASFYSAYRKCWQRVAADKGAVESETVLAQLEQDGNPKELVQKWREKFNLDKWRETSRAVVQANAQCLMNADMTRAANQVATQSLSALTRDPTNAREELVALANSILGIVESCGEEARPLQIVAEADALGYVLPISTGWARMDKALSGGGASKYGGIRYHEGDIWVIGAPSGHGKSSFGCNLVVNLLRQGFASLYITWEMSKLELIRRMVCNLGNISYDVASNPNEARNKEESDARLSAVDALSNYVRLYEKPNTVAEIGEVIKRHRIEFGDRLRGVVVDHIGIAKNTTGRDTWRHLEELVYAVKGVAREQHVAIFCFSQVPESIESQLRDANRTTGSDFRGSRGIRMGVDAAMFLCRHNGKDGNGTLNTAYQNVTCVQIVKDRRFGHEDWFTMKYDPTHYSLSDYQVQEETRRFGDS